MRPDREELLDLVARMRAAQREYFRTRSTAALDEARRLEREVDAAVATALDSQLTLFEG